MVQPEIAERRPAAEHAARELEPGGERIARPGAAELALEQAHHRGLPDREPAHIVLGLVAWRVQVMATTA